jgi:hypothetical protein
VSFSSAKVGICDEADMGGWVGKKGWRSPVFETFENHAEFFHGLRGPECR